MHSCHLVSLASRNGRRSADSRFQDLRRIAKVRFDPAAVRGEVHGRACLSCDFCCVIRRLVNSCADAVALGLSSVPHPARLGALAAADQPFVLLNLSIALSCASRPPSSSAPSSSPGGRRRSLLRPTTPNFGRFLAQEARASSRESSWPGADAKGLPLQAVMLIPKKTARRCTSTCSRVRPHPPPPPQTYWATVACPAATAMVVPIQREAMRVAAHADGSVPLSVVMPLLPRWHSAELTRLPAAHRANAVGRHLRCTAWMTAAIC